MAFARFKIAAHDTRGTRPLGKVHACDSGGMSVTWEFARTCSLTCAAWSRRPRNSQRPYLEAKHGEAGIVSETIAQQPFAARDRGIARPVADFPTLRGFVP